MVDAPEDCGAVHPNRPELKCQRIGKCPTDDHLAVQQLPNGQRRWVRFGRSAEDHAEHFGVRGEYPIIPIRV